VIPGLVEGGRPRYFLDMADPARVLEQALELDPPERAALARQLIRSLDEADEGVHDAWREEIGKRIDAVEAGSAELEDWSETHERLRRAFSR